MSNRPMSPMQRARVESGETFCPSGEHYAADVNCTCYEDSNGGRLRLAIAGAFAQVEANEAASERIDTVDGHLCDAGDAIDEALNLLRDMLVRARGDKRQDDVENLLVQIAEITRAGRVIAEHVTA